MENIYKVRDEAFKLASRMDEKTDPVTSCNSIYIGPTSNIIDTLSLYDNPKKVLSVCSTGAHCYEALLNGAEEIDLFDINELQLLYFELMQTAIIHLSYEKFITHFTLPIPRFFYTSEDLKCLLCQDMYSAIEHDLSKDAQTVFGPLYDYFDSTDIVRSDLFRTSQNITRNHLKSISSIYNEEQYYKLQKILRSGKYRINVHTMSLIDIPKNLQGKYDLIILDNILQYYKKLEGLNTPRLVNKFITKKLSNLINDDGVIQVNYGFEVATDAFKDEFNIPLNRKLMKFERATMLDAKKETVNIPLIKKYDGYSYDFIKGVEWTNERCSDNLVLSYKKQTR